MSTPRVTVLMSVHNGDRWLRAAIDSVLAQTWRDFEFLIIDDASSDDTTAQVESVRDPRIRLIRLPENIGLTRSLNIGLRESRGDLIARHDSDDLSAPERLAKQVTFLSAHPDVALVGSQARLIDAGGHSRGARDLPLGSNGIRWLSLLDNPIIHTAAMFRAAVVRDELGGYDESFGCCQDYDLWARLLERHPARNLPERLVAVREHGGSISATRGDEARKMVRRVVRRLANVWLPRLALSDAEVALLRAYRRHLAPEEVAPFRELLARCHTEFSTRFGAADRELARTQAAVFARIGYNLLTRDRGIALKQFADAVRVSPGTATRIPWLRVAALLVLGDRARKWAERARACPASTH
jgi:glycosyltransferase involved in cell wall biosynthesis